MYFIRTLVFVPPQPLLTMAKRKAVTSDEEDEFREEIEEDASEPEEPEEEPKVKPKVRCLRLQPVLTLTGRVKP